MPTKSARHIALGACMAMMALSAATAADPPRFVSVAASKVSAAASRAEGAVARGLHRTASAVERGASATSGAVNRTARRLGLPSSAASSPNP